MLLLILYTCLVLHNGLFLNVTQEDLSSAVAQQLSSKAAEQELASKLQLVEAKLSKTEAEHAAVQKKVRLETFKRILSL
jgi:hypothetical protein